MKRIFVVEDEAIVALELQDKLRRLGYEVCGHAARAAAALRDIPPARPDLVLMDINLGPGMTGIEVAERLRPVLDVPVVFVTAYSDADLIQDAVRTDAFAYVVKPFIPDALRANIEMALLRHDAERRLRAAQERYRQLFEEAIEGIFRSHADGRILAANPAFARMLGYDSPDELIGTDATALYVDPAERRRLWALRETQGKVEGFETRLIKKSGERITVEIFARLVPDPDGKQDTVQGMIRDVTEQAQHRAALEVLSTGLAVLTGAAFYNEVAAQLAAIVDAEVGFVATIQPGTPTRIRSLGLAVDGKEAPAIERELAGSPCERIAARKAIIIPEDVQRLYPDDRALAEFGGQAYVAWPLVDSASRVIGSIGVLARKPLAHPERVVSVARLFALRVTAELERSAPAPVIEHPGAAAPIGNAPTVAGLTLRFCVSRDEEYIELRAAHSNGTIDLRARAHHYLLLQLARIRLDQGGLPPDDQGWIHQDILLRQLRTDTSRLYLDIYRIRRQLADAGVSDAANIIERRPGTRQLRLGVARIEIAGLAHAGEL